MVLLNVEKPFNLQSQYTFPRVLACLFQSPKQPMANKSSTILIQISSSTSPISNPHLVTNIHVLSSQHAQPLHILRWTLVVSVLKTISAASKQSMEPRSQVSASGSKEIWTYSGSSHSPLTLTPKMRHLFLSATTKMVLTGLISCLSLQKHYWLSSGSP